MFATPFFASFLYKKQIALIALTIVLCIVACTIPVAAASANESPIVNAAPAGILFGNFVNEVAGNRTRMIQIGCVFAAIGIYLLSRTVR